MAKGKIRWLGHSFVEFTTADNKIIYFDPWTKEDGNPATGTTLDEIERADLVLVSHDHLDHVASAMSICDKTGALLGGAVQTVARLQAEGLASERVVNFGAGYMVGGGVNLDWVTVTAIPAMHSSDTACALGHIVQAQDGTTLYHAGDTSIFGDMKLWAESYPLDLACLPIGGVFTMDAGQASLAAAMLKPDLVLPIHYASFPIVAQSPGEFVDLTAKRAPEVRVLTPEVGEAVVLS